MSDNLLSESQQSWDVQLFKMPVSPVWSMDSLAQRFDERWWKDEYGSMYINDDQCTQLSGPPLDALHHQGLAGDPNLFRCTAWPKTRGAETTFPLCMKTRHGLHHAWMFHDVPEHVWMLSLKLPLRGWETEPKCCMVAMYCTEITNEIYKSKVWFVTANYLNTQTQTAKHSYHVFSSIIDRCLTRGSTVGRHAIWAQIPLLSQYNQSCRTLYNCV